MSEENQAGAWIITHVWSASGVQIDIKESGANGVDAVDRLYTTIKHGIEKYNWKTENVNAPKQTAQQSASQPTQSTAPAKSGAVETGINTLEVAKVEITPKPDNKVELKLFASGHRYPDLFHNGTIQQVLTALSTTGFEWNAAMLEKSNVFDLHFFADWRNSEKLNSNGKPYKNIVGYRPIDATV